MSQRSRRFRYIIIRAAIRGGHSDKMSGAPWPRGARRAPSAKGLGPKKMDLEGPEGPPSPPALGPLAEGGPEGPPSAKGLGAQKWGSSGARRAPSAKGLRAQNGDLADNPHISRMQVQKLMTSWTETTNIGVFYIQLTVTSGRGNSEMNCPFLAFLCWSRWARYRHKLVCQLVHVLRFG